MGTSLKDCEPELAERGERVLYLGGGRIWVNEAFRDYATQVLYRKRYELYISGKGPWAPLAAIPGTSKHGKMKNGKPYAEAIDFGCNAKLPSEVALRDKLCKEAGLHFPVRGEDWHAELAPNRKPLPPLPQKAAVMIPIEVDACSNLHGPGYYVLTSDGGVEARDGAPFFGSYPGLDPKHRQGQRQFYKIECIEDRPGYRTFATGRTRYVFDEAGWKDDSIWQGR